MTILGIDVSHHQNDAGPLDFTKVRASGREFVVIKATEGTGYVDPALAANRRNAHAAGLIVGFYHFARLGSPAAEAAWFARTVGPLQPGEFIVLDYEPNPVPPGSAAWSKAWLDAARAALGVAPLIYMNTYTMGADNWSGVARDYGLWLAKYDHSTVASPTRWWPTEAMKQDNDKSLVVGVIGGVDDDVFYGTTAQLLAYGKGGRPVPAPASIVQEDDMRLIRDPNGTVWRWTETDLSALSDPTLSGAAQRAWGGLFDVSAGELASIQADCAAAKARAEATLVGYGKRIERIDEGKSGGKLDPWGYGLRIQDTQAKVDALAGSSDPQAVADAILAKLPAQPAAAGGLTKDDVTAAVKSVFAAAGQP